MFPRYSDWDVAYTPSGLLRQRIKKVLGYGVPIGIAIAIAWAGGMDGLAWKEGARNLLLTLADTLN